MNILIGILTIVFSLYIYIVNRPRSIDAKRIFALLIVSGVIMIFGYISFSTPLRAFLSVISILSVAVMFLGFYGQICYDEAHKPDKCNRKSVTKGRSYGSSSNKSFNSAA